MVWFDQTKKSKLPIKTFWKMLLANVSHNQTVRHKLPQILDRELFYTVFAFDVVELAMTTVAGYHNHLGTYGFYLLNLAATVVNAFVTVTGNQCATTATATNLIHLGGIEINPVFEALIEDPAGFFKVTIAEHFLGPASVVAGIVIGGRFLDS